MHLPLETDNNNNEFIIAVFPTFSPVKFVQYHVRKFSTNYAHLSYRAGIKFSAKAEQLRVIICVKYEYK